MADKSQGGDDCEWKIYLFTLAHAATIIAAVTRFKIDFFSLFSHGAAGQKSHPCVLELPTLSYTFEKFRVKRL